MLRKDQANVKFDALAKSSKAAFEDARGMPTLEDGMAPVEDEPNASDAGFTETLLGGQTSDEDTDEDTDDDLAWATQSLLSSPMSTFGGTLASSKPAGRSKAAAARSSKPPSVLSSRASVASSVSSTKTPAGPPTQAVLGEGAMVTPKKPGRGRAAISAKLATQGAEQVLGPHGLDEIKGFLDEIAKRLTFKPFTASLRGTDHAKYVQEFAEVKRTVLSAQKAAVALNTKVNKWVETPGDVQQLLARHQAMTSAYSDCFTHFGFTSKTGNDIGKMEKTSAACQACGVEMPLAFKSLLFLEKSLDLLRFQEIELFNLYLNMGKGQGGFFAKETPEVKETVRPLILEAIGDGLNMLSQGMPGSADVAQHAHKQVMEMAYQLSLLTPDTLDIDAQTKLALLATSMGQGSPSHEDREAACAKLADLAQDAGYSGVPKPLFSDASWPVLRQLSDQFNKIDEAQILANSLAKEFEKTSQHIYLTSDMAIFLDLLVRALSSYDKCERKRPVMKKLEMSFAAMAQLSSEGLKNCRAELAMLCKHLTAGPASADAVQHSMVADRSARSAKDVVFKSTFNMSALQERMDDGSKQLLTTGSLSNFTEPLQGKFDQAQRVLSLMEQLLKLQVLSANMNMKKDEQDKGKDLAEMVELLGKIKAECAAIVGSGEQLLAADVEACASQYNVHSAGRNIYAEKLKAFQSAVLGMIEGFLGTQADAAHGVAAIASSSELVAAAGHQLNQLADWSDTPVHDQACIRFASEELHSLCNTAAEATSMLKPTTAKFKPDAALRQALAAVCALELSKPKLVWLVGDGDASQRFLDYARKISQATAPAEAAYVQNELAQLRGAMSKLEKALVPDPSSLDDKAFHAALGNSTPAKARALRKDTKQLMVMDASEPFRTEDDANAVMSVLAEAQQIIDEAKHQTIKWGLLSFILHPEIRTATSLGLDLRSKLKMVWQQHSTDAAVTGYVGPAVQQCIAEILAADMAPKQPRPQRGSKRLASDPSPAAPKGKAKRQSQGHALQGSSLDQ